jgi:hypothetical protein
MKQAVPKEDTPNKAWQRKKPAASTYQKQGKEARFGKEDLPHGKIKQNRAKPGMTSPQ